MKNLTGKEKPLFGNMQSIGIIPEYRNRRLIQLSGGTMSAMAYRKDRSRYRHWRVLETRRKSSNGKNTEEI